MTKLDMSEVRRIARLARLSLDDADVERLAGDMAEVLDHFEEIDQAVAASARGIRERGLAKRTQPDDSGSDALLRPPSAMAPDWREGFFVVPSLEALREDA
jgi:aspartyl-tRNA(Asn)/glutamyl-tRNA(Gln) amidotransferase subunit C